MRTSHGGDLFYWRAELSFLGFPPSFLHSQRERDKGILLAFPPFPPPPWSFFPFRNGNHSRPSFPPNFSFDKRITEGSPSLFPLSFTFPPLPSPAYNKPDMNVPGPPTTPSQSREVFRCSWRGIKERGRFAFPFFPSPLNSPFFSCGG